MKTNLLLIVGPTASGKTALALQLASMIECEIISADSRQIYKHLDIGTAKPLLEERRKVPHHLIDELLPSEYFTAGKFVERANELILQINQRKKLPIIVGGTGLYIRALVDGLFEGIGRSTETREKLEERLKKEGAEILWKELNSVDPKSATTIHPTQTRRVIRALEVYYETGKPISEYHQEHQQQKKEQKFNTLFIGLQWERKILYERINIRVEKMLQQGFLDELKNLLSLGYDERLQALQTVGYKEGFSFLRGEIPYERMVELMKQNTRRYAKRQLTWFRADERIQWFPIEDEEQISEIAKQVL